MEIKGQLFFRNNRAIIKTETCVEIDLFSWLASWGLKDKEIKILVERKEVK